MNWKALTKTARRTLSRNSSKILLGFGIAGAFTAVGFAITATPKAMILLDEKKKELGVEKLDAKTIVKTAAPVYIPTAISMAVSTGCIIGASSVNDRRNAALAAAYTMSETALRSYQDKVAATIGEDKAQEIKEAVTLEKMAKCPEPDEIPTAKNLAPDDVSYDKKVKCWESLSGKYFWTTRNAIEKALNGLNKQLLSDLSVTENDLYDYLGMEHCKNGDLLGWDTQSCMMVDGDPGSGKSTVLNIVQKLFEGYCGVFDSRALGSSSNAFALEAFKSNPLVSITCIWRTLLTGLILIRWQRKLLLSQEPTERASVSLKCWTD